jgi:hypothetical protein
MENLVAPIWCPMRGIDCKDPGDNIFIFTLHFAFVNKKAIKGGGLEI